MGLHFGNDFIGDNCHWRGMTEDLMKVVISANATPEFGLLTKGRFLSMTISRNAQIFSGSKDQRNEPKDI